MDLGIVTMLQLGPVSERKTRERLRYRCGERFDLPQSSLTASGLFRWFGALRAMKCTDKSSCVFADLLTSGGLNFCNVFGKSLKIFETMP